MLVVEPRWVLEVWRGLETWPLLDPRPPLNSDPMLLLSTPTWLSWTPLDTPYPVDPR